MDTSTYGRFTCLRYAGAGPLRRPPRRAEGETGIEASRQVSDFDIRIYKKRRIKMSKGMLNDMMKQAKKMQQEMGKVQEEARKKTVEAAVGGGMVTVIANGAMEILSIKIDREVVNPDDIDMLQDLVTAASNEALRRAQQMVNEEIGKVTGGLNIPGLGNILG